MAKIKNNYSVCSYRINPVSYAKDKMGVPIPNRLNIRDTWFNSGSRYEASLNCSELLPAGENDNHIYGKMVTDYANSTKKTTRNYEGYDRFNAGEVQATSTDIIKTIINHRPEPVHPNSNLVNVAHCEIILDFSGRGNIKAKAPRPDYDIVIENFHGLTRTFVPVK